MSQLTFDIFQLIRQLTVLQTGLGKKRAAYFGQLKTIDDTIDAVGQSYLRVTEYI